jgi:hypothetical protein
VDAALGLGAEDAMTAFLRYLYARPASKHFLRRASPSARRRSREPRYGDPSPRTSDVRKRSPHRNRATGG